MMNNGRDTNVVYFGLSGSRPIVSRQPASFDPPKDCGGVGPDIPAEYRLDVLPAAGVGDVLRREALPL